MKTPRNAALAIAAVVMAVSLAGLGARATYGARTSADEPQYLLTALSLYEDGDLDIADERYSGVYHDFHEAFLPVQTELRADGTRVSPHNPLLPLYLAVPMGLADWAGAKVAMAALAGALAGLLYWVAVVRFGVAPRLAGVVTVLLALSPPLAIYATQVYPEVPAALAVTGAIAAITGNPGRRMAVGALVAIVALPWLAVKYVPVAAALAVAAVSRLRGRPRLLTGFVMALALAGGAYLWFDQVVYGGWTPYAAGDHFVAGEFTAVGSRPDYLARSQRLLGLLVDRGFGLAAWQPLYLAVVPAAAWWLRRRPRHWGIILGVAATGWLVATFVAQTMHGWWWPGRQVVVILPALALMLMAWIPGRRWILATGIVGVVSFLVLAWETTTGRLALIVDFTATVNPFYRLWRLVLPDYLDSTPLTWVLHAAWLVVLVAVVRLAGRHSIAVPPRRHAATVGS